MAIVNSYPVGIPKANDLLVGTSIPSPNTNDQPSTKNFSLQAVADLTATAGSPNILICNWSKEAGAVAVPVLDVLRDTLGTNLTYTFTRLSTGVFVLTASSPVFTVGKTQLIVSAGDTGLQYPQVFLPAFNSTTSITLQAVTIANQLTDAAWVSGNFNIYVYN